MSPGREYRQLVARIAKASLARKFRKPLPWLLVDALIMGALAVFILALLAAALAVLPQRLTVYLAWR
jgi:hypothetical protein